MLSCHGSYSGQLPVTGCFGRWEPSPSESRSLRLQLGWHSSCLRTVTVIVPPRARINIRARQHRAGCRGGGPVLLQGRWTGTAGLQGAAPRQCWPGALTPGFSGPSVFSCLLALASEVGGGGLGHLPLLPSEVGGGASTTSPRSVSPKILLCSKGDAERITQGEKKNGKLYSDLTLRIYIPRPVATI